MRKIYYIQNLVDKTYLYCDDYFDLIWTEDITKAYGQDSYDDAFQIISNNKEFCGMFLRIVKVIFP